MASNIPGVQLKKNIVFLRCEAVIFEVLKNPCVFGDGVCTGSSCLFLCNLHSQGSPTVVLVPASVDKSRKGTSRVSLQNRWEPRSSSQLQGQKMLSEFRIRRIHTHTFYFLPAFMDVSRHRYPFVILIPLFFVFFFLSLDANRLRGESSFRPEPLCKPPYEPSLVDIQFHYNFKKLYTDIPLELSKDDQVLLLQGFNDVL